MPAKLSLQVRPGRGAIMLSNHAARNPEVSSLFKETGVKLGYEFVYKHYEPKITTRQES